MLMPGGRRGHAARRWLLALGVLVIVAALGVLVVQQLQAARIDLTAAQEDLDAAVEHLRDQQWQEAADAFAEAQERAGEATATLRGPAGQAVAIVPVVGDTATSATAISQAAELVARAGAQATAAVAEQPGGLAAFAPQDGQIPLTVQELAGPLQESVVLLEFARDLVASAPEDTTLDQVDQARATLLAELDQNLPGLRTAAALVDAIPSYLGADGPRRYFVGAQNPAELRGSGGLIGAYAVMTVGEEGVDFGEFAPIQSLPTDVFQTEQLPPEYADRYATFLQGSGVWLNLNMSPHFPSVAEVILTHYQAATGEHLDGVILVDPHFLRALLEVTGPVEVPEVGALEADSVVDYIANEAVVELGTGAERKDVLGDAAATVLEVFLQGGHDPGQAISALGEAAAQGSVLMYSAHPRVQDALEAGGLAGQLVPAEPMNLAVTGTNLVENKLDYYMDRSVDYELILDTDGSATGVITVTLTNDAPTTGLPAYIIGPSAALAGDLQAGDNSTWVNVFCGPCIATDSTASWGDVTPLLAEERGHTVLVTAPEVAAGGSQSITHVVEIPQAWSPVGNSAEVEFAVQDQPTINPTALQVTITGPPGWSIGSAREDMVVEGSEVQWQGDPSLHERFTLQLYRATGA